ncbi:MAG: hypothetical protein H7A34_01920 [bacterium]|nr:hypothetical protein [bacterium]
MKKLFGLLAIALLMASSAHAQDTYKTIPTEGTFGESGTAAIFVYEDQAATTLASSLALVTSSLNARFPNQTTGWLASVGGRLFLKVDHGPLENDTWDVAMFTDNAIDDTGLVHTSYSNEIIKLKYRASSFLGSYDDGTFADGYESAGLDTNYFSGDFPVTAALRWLVNSTTGAFDDLATGDQGYAIIASGTVEHPTAAWDYDDTVEIIYIMGLLPGDDGSGYNANLTADKPGKYTTTICFEVVNY